MGSFRESRVTPTFCNGLVFKTPSKDYLDKGGTKLREEITKEVFRELLLGLN